MYVPKINKGHRAMPGPLFGCAGYSPTQGYVTNNLVEKS